MDYDQDKVDEMVLALLYLTMFRARGNQSMEGTRLGSAGPAARQRLHLGSEEQGQVSGHDRGISNRARELFERHFVQKS
jgi:hypothetical protein